VSARWVSRALCAAAVALLLAGCGSNGSGQTGNSFTFLTADVATVGAVNSNLDSPAVVSTSVCVRLQNNLKNPTLTAPTGLDDIQVTSYTVSFTRFDGGPPPGPFTVNTAITVPAGQTGQQGQSPIVGNTRNVLIVLVPAGAKRDAPLNNPRPRLPLNTNADILFQGRDNRGQRHEARVGVTVVFIADEATSETLPTCTN
jgi:hypothetical protein